MLYFGLPSVGITLPAFTAAVLGFILCNAAYNSEYIRGAILSIKDGQITAAQALGMTRWQTIESIVLPQAMRRAGGLFAPSVRYAREPRSVCRTSSTICVGW